MNYKRSKKLIGSLALIFVFALSIMAANITPVFAQEPQQSSPDSSQERQQSDQDSANGGSACRVVYREYRQAPVCCNRVLVGGGYNRYGYRSYDNGRKFRTVPW